jgi:hypothetical protein
LVTEFGQGGIGSVADGLAQTISVGVPAGFGSVASGAGSDVAAEATALLESSHPGGADAVLVGDLLGSQSGVTVLQHALA